MARWVFAGSYETATVVALTLPTGAFAARVQAYSGEIRYRLDGLAPTVDSGMVLANDTELLISGPIKLTQARFLNGVAGSGAKIRVQYRIGDTDA